MNKILTSLLLLFVFMPGGVVGGELDELTAMCESCHGPGGASPYSDVPIIGGQTDKYIRGSLQSYQVWGRPCVKTLYRSGDTSRPKTDMCKITAGLSDEDIRELAGHYSSLPWVPAPQPFDANQVEAGAALHQEHCETCHEQGASVGGIGPRLAGQWVPYLKHALKFVPTGEHMVPPAMERTLGEFSEQDIAALMNYYASQQN